MKRFLFALLLVCLLVNAEVQPKDTQSLKRTPKTKESNDIPIKNVVVICMENHSYDNMLGFMDAPIGDLSGQEYNQEVPHTQSSKKYYATKGADFQTEPDPAHGFTDVNFQLYGTKDYPLNNSRMPDNTGFVKNFIEKGGDAQHIMNIYSPQQVPIISALAENFKTNNRWFCSVPTCTDPNKFFIYGASSQGVNDNCGEWYCEHYPLKMSTIFDSFEADNHSWSIHYMDWCEAMAVEPLSQKKKDHYIHDQDYDLFFKKLDDGNLDTLTYLVPRIFSSDPEYPYPNTQHPSEDIRSGEQLLKQVYEKIRNSDYWDKMMLVVVYDEHGGFWDSVPPTQTVPNPYPQSPGVPHAFSYDRTGPRVPSIIISPWIDKGVDSTMYDHSSIPATLKNLFDLSSDYLTPRDAAANHFITKDKLRTTMRTDCPEKLPDLYPSLEAIPLRPIQKYLHGNVSNQVKILGSMLVNKRMLRRLHWEEIIFSIIEEKQSYTLFMECAQALGFKLRKPVEYFYLKDKVMNEGECED